MSTARATGRSRLSRHSAVSTPGEFTVRRARPEDDEAVAAVLAAAASRSPAFLFEEPAIDLPSVRRHLQTGSTYFVAEADSALVAVCRCWEHEGSLWAGAIAATASGAGRAVVAAAERFAQDEGLRWVRIPFAEETRATPLLQRWGYQVVSREHRTTPDGDRWERLVAEKRLRLLTVRPGRRGDEPALGSLGIDGAPQLCTVALDGDAVVAAVMTEPAGPMDARLGAPALVPGYEGRGIEAWLAEVAARTQAMAGRYRLLAPKDAYPADLLSRGWLDDGPHYARDLGEVLTFE